MVKEPLLFFESRLNKEGTKRELFIDKYTTYFNLLYNLYPNNQKFLLAENGYPLKDDELLPALKLEFYDCKKKLYGIIKGEIKLEDTALEQTYQKFIKYKSDKSFTREKFASNMLEVFNLILPNIKYLDNILSKPLNTVPLKESINSPEMRFAFAMIILNISRDYIKDLGLVHNSFIYAATYYKNITKEDQNLKTKIGGKVYSINDFVNLYEKIRFEHPEFEVYSIPITENEKNCLDIEYIQAKAKEVKNISSMTVNWNILPAGQIIRTDKEELGKSQNGTDRELKRRHIVKIKSLLDSSNSIMIISGINDFYGYVGYVYDNGVVVFEKIFNHYNSSEDYSVAVDNATYVMEISNFIELTKTTKIDLIKKIRSGEANALRIMHDHSTGLENWISQMQNCITGGEHTLTREDIMKYLPEESQR